MKTEPDCFSYADLVNAGREPWDGVRNNAALKHMREMQPGDLAMIYHTGDERSIAGVARVVAPAYPDPSGGGNPRFVMVDVSPLYPFKHPVTLAMVKADPRFSGWDLVRQSRLSVMEVSADHWHLLHAMGETVPVAE